ncbi:molybdate ABC transporter substrate-binding protein [Roseivirga misakiensis]|uniref:Molybdate ABC transporter substrate-binding protein n=1 Tax=Roseivirga misakiensis TaxID=1563681 RepID=A0A1E5T092_9BACT|nr:molybdate ABC transporter substrate-binding protein [Roseivirga misakiensis]OEK04776.1 molybdate ABC transporter substrate-binding protein [Roseivirga misakiensis]
MRQIGLVLFLAITALSCSKDTDPTLRVATSANMQFAMEALEKVFEKQSGHEIEVILGSSGKLTSQIVAGAPYDLFFSADTRFPQKLFDDGISDQAPKIYAYGKLVVWSALDSVLSKDQEAELRTMKMALANPKTAPYGQAAIEYLTATGDIDKINDRLVFGESIAQVNQFLLTGAVRLGFTSKSSIYAEAFQGKGQWTEIPTEMYEPLAQSMIILAQREALGQQAQEFYDFVLSSNGQKILDNFGYSTVNN